MEGRKKDVKDQREKNYKKGKKIQKRKFGQGANIQDA